MTCPHLKRRAGKAYSQLGSDKPLKGEPELYCALGRLKRIPQDEDILERCRALPNTATEADCPLRKEGLVD
jgi:hypothetical protein